MSDSESDLRFLLERQGVIDTINELFLATDAREWERVRALLAPRVQFDMTSLSGGESSLQTPAEIVGGWEKGLRPIRSIHHQIGNFRVRLAGGEAQAFCYGIAIHYLPHPSGRNTRTFVGSYDFHLVKEADRWLIDALRFPLKFLDGNAELESSG